MPLNFEFSYTNPLESVEMRDAKPGRVDFEAADALKVVIEPHAPGVFRLRLGAAAAFAEEKPGSRRHALTQALLAREDAIGECEVQPLADATGWQLVQGDCVLEVRNDPLRVTLHRAGRPVVSSSESAEAPAFGLYASDSGEPEIWTVGLQLAQGEGLYGLGETVGDLNRRDETIVSDDPQYRALPLAWSPSGWGVYVNTFARVVHEAGAADAPNHYVVSVESPLLDLFLFVGEPLEILNQYSALTGRAGQPVLWAMGAWLNQAPGQSGQDVLGQLQRLREASLPIDAIALAAPAVYSLSADKSVLEWDAARMGGDPRALLTAFHDANAHVCAPTFPGVTVGTQLFEELEDRGWLLTGADGGAHVFEGVPASGSKSFALLDLTYRDAYALWVERQHQWFEEGLDTASCDAQLAIPDGVSARNGLDGAALRSFYPALARRALFDAVAGHKVPPEGVVPGTDLFPAAQRLPWQSGPAVSNDWAGLSQSLRAALSVGASGVPVQVHALGNATQPLSALTPELYLRWLTCVVFSANFSFQGSDALLPTAFDEATLEHARTWLQWRYRLIPYVLGAIEDSARNGLPVQRSMVMSFPADSKAHAWDLQYLLGPALLVAPILQPGGKTEVYLPQGDAWWDLNTGQRYEGGTYLTMDCALDQFPVFGREGHMLCLGPVTQHTGEFNSARLLEEVWIFGMPTVNPAVMRNKIRVMQMQGSSYIKGLEGLRILPSEGLEVKRRGAEVRISRAR